MANNVVRSLGVAQADFGADCSSACAMVATVVCHCLLGSRTRQPEAMVASLAAWTAIGCWLFRGSTEALARATSADPTHKSRSLHTNPVTISRVVPAIGRSMQAVGEFSGLLYMPASQEPSIDAEFAADEAFLSLEAVMAELLMRAVERPVACTFIAKGSVHAIAISRRSAAAAADHQGRPPPLERLELSGDPEADLAMADVLWQGQFHIDFVDSHRNDAHRGLPDARGAGVWIELPSMLELCVYLRRRYPPASSEEAELAVAPTLYTRRKNSFEACVWQSLDEALDHRETPLFELAARLLERPKFEEWRQRALKSRESEGAALVDPLSRKEGKRRKDKEKRPKRPRPVEEVVEEKPFVAAADRTTPRQRLEKAMRKLEDVGSQ